MSRKYCNHDKNDNDFDNSFNYTDLSISYEEVRHDFRMIFEAPCLSRESKLDFVDKFYDKYLNYKTVRNSVEGNYILFLNYYYL
jgi:hypothetical protein